MHYFRALSRFSADSEYSQNGSQNSAKSEKVATQVNSAKKKNRLEYRVGIRAYSISGSKLS